MGVGSTDFIGTTNSTDLVFKTNNQERLIIKGVTGGFRIKSLEGVGNALVITDENGQLYRNNFPNNANYVLSGNGNFVNISTLIPLVNVPALSGWTQNAGIVTLIDPNANVGIGGNPDVTNKLEIFGNAKIHGELLADSIKVKSIVVGDSSLHITTTGAPIYDPLTNSYVYNGKEIYTDYVSGGLFSTLNSSLYINCHSSNPSNTLFNFLGGNVGIGTILPTAKLDVRGNTKITGGVTITGNVGIGTILPTAKLDVRGTVKIGDVSSMPMAGVSGGYNLYVQYGILTERVKVAISGTGAWADYVFADDYELLSLDSVESYIAENKHLQGISSAEEMVTNGNDLGLTDKLLLEKIENLYLYIFQLNKEIKIFKEENGPIKTQNKLLQAQNELLKAENELLKTQNELLKQQNEQMGLNK